MHLWPHVPLLVWPLNRIINFRQLWKCWLWQVDNWPCKKMYQCLEKMLICHFFRPVNVHWYIVAKFKSLSSLSVKGSANSSRWCCAICVSKERTLALLVKVWSTARLFRPRKKNVVLPPGTDPSPKIKLKKKNAPNFDQISLSPPPPFYQKWGKGAKD